MIKIYFKSGANKFFNLQDEEVAGFYNSLKDEDQSELIELKSMAGFKYVFRKSEIEFVKFYEANYDL